MNEPNKYRTRGWRTSLLAGVAALALVGGTVASGARRAVAQSGSTRIGNVVIKAPHSEFDFEANTLTLTRGVDINMDGDKSLSANEVVLTLARNAAGKQDVNTATANGNVRIRMVETVKPKEGPAYKRVVNATAARATMYHFQNKAVLTGNVNLTADEPTRTLRWRNAATATIDMATGKVNADAPNGEQMNVEIQSKGGAG